MNLISVSLMPESKRLVLRLNARLFDALHRWADDELRSVNGQIEYLLTDQARRSGRLARQSNRRPRGDAAADDGDPEADASRTAGPSPRYSRYRQSNALTKIATRTNAVTDTIVPPNLPGTCDATAVSSALAVAGAGDRPSGTVITRQAVTASTVTARLRTAGRANSAARALPAPAQTRFATRTHPSSAALGERWRRPAIHG
jgi:hypothetical protein